MHSTLLSTTDWKCYWYLLLDKHKKKLMLEVNYTWQHNINIKFGILWLLVTNTQTCKQPSADRSGFQRFISLEMDQTTSCSDCPKKWRYSGSHTAEEVYSAWVPSLSPGVGSCWSLHIPLAALLTQNTLMTSPLLLLSRLWSHPCFHVALSEDGRSEEERKGNYAGWKTSGTTDGPRSDGTNGSWDTEHPIYCIICTNPLNHSWIYTDSISVWK